MSYTYSTSIQIKAADEFTNDIKIQCADSSAPNLIDGFDEDSILCQKLEYDVENNSTNLPTTFLILFSIICNIFVYAVTKKSIIDFFFNGKNQHVATDLLKQSGETYKIDNYKITLEEYLCEEKTQLGYLVFSITKDGGKPEADIDDNGYCHAFGKNIYFSTWD